MSSNISLPNSWQVITNTKNIVIRSNDSLFFSASIFIPNSASSGEYNLKLVLTNKLNESIASCPFKVTIKRLILLDVKSGEGLRYVFSGDTIRSGFYIENHSNCNTNLSITELNCELIGDYENFHLLADSIVFVPVKVNISKNVNIPEDYYYQLVVSVENSKEYKKYGYGKVRVLPSLESSTKRYLKFPVKLSGFLVGEEIRDQFYCGFQSEILGEGYLDIQNNHYLRFKLIGPNRYYKSVLGRMDEYFVQYKNSNIDVELGDRVFSVTQLSEYSRYGRGFDLKVNFLNCIVGVQYNKPRFFSSIENEYSMSVMYKGNENFSLGSYFLSKKMSASGSDANLYSLVGKTNLGFGLKLEGECSYGDIEKEHGMAYLVKGRFSQNKINTSFVVLNASKYFPGFYQNTNYFTGNLSYKVSKKMQFTLGVRKDEQNSQKDTLFGTSPFLENIRFGLRYKYSSTGNVYLLAGIESKQDRMKVKQFDYEEQFSRLSFHQKLGVFEIEANSKVALSQNRLLNHKGNSWSSEIDILYPFSLGELSLYSSYERCNHLEDKQESQFIYGASISTSLSKKTNLICSYKNNYSIEEYYKNRSLFDLSCVQKIGRNHSIELNTNYSLLSNTVRDKGFYAGLKYSLLLNVPIKKTIEYGFLIGKIDGLGIKKLEGITLYLGGNVAVTDAEGFFKFVNVIPGKYYLLLDRSTIGLFDMPSVKVPIEIDMQKGANSIRFSLIKQARIKGVFSIENEQKTVRNKSSSKKVIIEIWNEDFKCLKIADLSKPFLFSKLLFGTYTLRFKIGGDGSEYRFLENDIKINLKEGEEKCIVVKLERRGSQIKFQEQNLQVIMEEK